MAAGSPADGAGGPAGGGAGAAIGAGGAPGGADAGGCGAAGRLPSSGFHQVGSEPAVRDFSQALRAAASSSGLFSWLSGVSFISASSRDVACGNRPHRILQLVHAPHLCLHVATDDR
ncbi:MAG: hypothetical protein E6I85_08525 [Chloroflexi bacterium]|nr:MAG: hypothetical protein E6I85_08525 [Chloroflexota bacterium]